MRGYVDSDTGQVHYRRSGEAGPALMLFHESPLTSAIYERSLPLLGRSVRAIAFDTPGYGLSDPPPAPLEIPGYAQSLLHAIDHLGVERFAVAGVHTGASLALEVARQAGRERVSGAILSGVALLTDEERAQYLKSWSPPLELDSEGHYLDWALARYRRIWGADAPPELLHVGIVAILSNYERYNWAYNAAFRYDPSPVLRQITYPVLLLNAEHDLLRQTDSRVMQLVKAEFIEVPGFRGQLPWRAPAAYSGAIVDFLARVEPRLASDSRGVS